jgi:hypothetical protein
MLRENMQLEKKRQYTHETLQESKKKWGNCFEESLSCFAVPFKQVPQLITIHHLLNL